ncbi:MAG: MBL fold metallo-hydrolase [Thermoleophilia bacterium]|nr:MBL fold metallo-hydrolase [Thermoleophilia bacterium]
MAQLVILGSSGWMPHDTSMTTSLALTLDEELVIFDAGSGLCRLLQHPFRLLIPPVDHTIHIYLTHLHLDHLIGLTFLPGLWSNPTVVHVPVDEAGGTGPETLDHLFGGPFFPVAFERLLPTISREAVQPGEWQMRGLRMRARRQEHLAGSLGYRVGDLLAFMTDCLHDGTAGDFARGARILVHEAWSSEADDPGAVRARAGGHSSVEQAARVAFEADVGELLLSHLPPVDAAHHAEMLQRAQAIFRRTVLCADGLTRELD